MAYEVELYDRRRESAVQVSVTLAMGRIVLHHLLCTEEGPVAEERHPVHEYARDVPEARRRRQGQRRPASRSTVLEL